MTKTGLTRQRHKRAMGAFFLALLTCALGLFFCLAKSPQAKSESWLAAAQHAVQNHDQAFAVRAAYEAVRLYPASVRGWEMLHALLQQNGHHDAALQAAAIAGRLRGGEEVPVIYAMPAELRLSLLTLAGGATP